MPLELSLALLNGSGTWRCTTGDGQPRTAPRPADDCHCATPVTGDNVTAVSGVSSGHCPGVGSMTEGIRQQRGTRLWAQHMPQTHSVATALCAAIRFGKHKDMTQPSWPKRGHGGSCADSNQNCSCFGAAIGGRFSASNSEVLWLMKRTSGTDFEAGAPKAASQGINVQVHAACRRIRRAARA